jgi:hypothetical protein
MEMPGIVLGDAPDPKTTLLVIVTISFFYGNAWYQPGCASDAKTTLRVILTIFFFCGNAWHRAGCASEAKTTLLVILNTYLSSMKMPGIVLRDTPDAKTTFLVILTVSFFYENAWYRAGCASDAKTILLVILNTRPSSIEMFFILRVTPGMPRRLCL